eukprot:CAMPEP_0203906600 /NCGR_PEP_ID=MMETSP0359-20131031/48191_1 /ASSEMBLY_ACC=CAM_ASM_000338 /TAXON_ID=268821 /ORGANISM="Scrippsiella Hangoei, Strain SHTV-5" /LENGTH=39 /DNA_ID= /DNA_START= /DNA_END= /DNA_ORIENTATION=
MPTLGAFGTTSSHALSSEDLPMAPCRGQAEFLILERMAD